MSERRRKKEVFYFSVLSEAIRECFWRGPRCTLIVLPSSVRQEEIVRNFGENWQIVDLAKGEEFREEGGVMVINYLPGQESNFQAERIIRRIGSAPEVEKLVVLTSQGPPAEVFAPCAPWFNGPFDLERESFWQISEKAGKWKVVSLKIEKGWGAK